MCTEYRPSYKLRHSVNFVAKTCNANKIIVMGETKAKIALTLGYYTVFPRING